MKSVLLILATLFSVCVQAHEFHTPNYCHSTVENFCAHIGYSIQPKANEAFEFVVHLMAKPADLANVQSVNVELYMPSMNHGSSPVKVERMNESHFQVSEAYFLMEGTWMVNVEVITANGILKFQIPFEVK